jgi:hypothetical protein
MHPHLTKAPAFPSAKGHSNAVQHVLSTPSKATMIASCGTVLSVLISHEHSRLQGARARSRTNVSSVRNTLAGFMGLARIIFACSSKRQLFQQQKGMAMKCSIY